MNKDIDMISEAYTKRVHKVLNEMTPYIGGEYGDFGSERAHSAYQADDGEFFKAFVGDQYQTAVRNFAKSPDYPLYIRKIVDYVGREILDEISDEDGRIEDSKREVAIRAGNIIGRKFPFQKSHLKHLGRNVIDALLRAGIIKEVDSLVGKGGGRRTQDFDPSVFDEFGD